MVKFAWDIIAKMHELTAQLAASYGEETRDLTLRVGIHSGPVTAGVLRGQKSRFQLFGDTVNTASRMESNGCPGRVHVSTETATELRRRGKASWLNERKDKVRAKGKGELTTYWVEPNGYRTSTDSTSAPYDRDFDIDDDDDSESYEDALFNEDGDGLTDATIAGSSETKLAVEELMRRSMTRLTSSPARLGYPVEDLSEDN